MADDSDYEFMDIKPDPHGQAVEEPLEATPVFDEYEANKALSISTRPEIRKGCTWDINFKIDPAVLEAEGINKIFLQQPKAGKDFPHLILKVRSKLIKPILELPFGKVAKIVNERDYLTPNDSGLIVLKARFTARPRAVFHKHADVMILLAAIKIGERTICTDKLDLIFRGGTGSVHGAEGRVKSEFAPQAPMMTFQQMQQQMQQMGMPIPSMPVITAAPMIQSMAPLTPSSMVNDQWDNNNINYNNNNISSMNNQVSFTPNISSNNGNMTTQFESMNSANLRDDFLQNKGDSLLLNQSNIGMDSGSMANFSNSDDSNGDWPMDTDQLDGGFVSSLIASSKGSTSGDYVAPAVSSSDVLSVDSNQSYTLVFNKRRGFCTDCVGECSYYKGIGGPCNECGCYPARHVDIDSPKSSLKRSASQANLNESSRESKRPRFLLEAKFFQKLFFSCMQYMTLPEIARVANNAPIPIFVKDENSVYIYINPTFCHFITDLSRTERVLNHTTQQVFEPRDASEVEANDKFLVQQGEGTVKTFDVSIKKQEFRVMKEYCALRDGKKVILGAVISSL